MPYFVYAGADGDQVALPCTERLYTEREAVQVAAYRVMPLLSLRGRPEVRLGGFTSLAGGTLAGFWAPAEMAAPQGAAVAPASEADQPDQSEPEAPAVADTPVPAVDEAAVPDGGAGATDDLDALLAGLSAPAPAAPDAAAAAGGEVDELDALLAGLNARPPAAAPDAPEADLDALLASLK
jgi:hypothetical protein